MLTDEAKRSRCLFVVKPKFCRVSSKLPMRSCEKNCCRQQKVIYSFSLLKRKNVLTRFSDRQLFLIDSTRYLSLAVCPNSNRSQKVEDEKKSSTRKIHQRAKVVDEKKLSTTSGLLCLQPYT